jgi:transcriptional regulator with XRE-family HTH domain
MSELKQYYFTLVLSGTDEHTEDLEDALFEAGCDDALLNFRESAVFLDFDRKAENIEDAVISAIKDVYNANIGASIVGVAPDLFVTQAEIAKRLNKSRQVVSLWIKGSRRGDIPFPKPVRNLNNKSPLWRWYDVTQWVYQQKQVKDSKIVDEARFFEAIDSVIYAQDNETKKQSEKLSKKLKKVIKKQAA